MKTYNVFVTKTGTEHYTVSAASFEAALVDFEARNPALREATNDSIESVTVEDHETGERRASGDIRKDCALAAKNLDTDEEDQFHDVPDWNGPRYNVLESIVRDLTVIKLSGDVPTLARLINRAKEARDWERGE
jgi:hypothetical protein